MQSNINKTFKEEKMMIRKILLAFMLVVSISCCKKEAKDEERIVFMYYRWYMETSCNIKVEDLKHRLENDVLKTDTVYVSDTIFNILKEVPVKIDAKADSVNHYDWRMVMFDGREYVYVSNRSLVAVSNGALAETPKLSYWRYVLKVHSKYYNDFWDLDDLRRDEDIKRWGVPKGWRYINDHLVQMTPVVPRRKIVFLRSE